LIKEFEKYALISSLKDTIEYLFGFEVVLMSPHFQLEFLRTIKQLSLVANQNPALLSNFTL